MDISKLSIQESWLDSDQCKELIECAVGLLEKDDLNPCDIETINNSVSDEYQEQFWERIMDYLDRM